jgi:hypothetical protein
MRAGDRPFLLGLGYRNHDPGTQPTRIGAQVDAPVHLGEPPPGLVEPGDQVLQVQRLADEPVPLKARHLATPYSSCSSSRLIRT